ncbi:MAG: cell division protein ZipA C-terminal FtsZ-binding domain-containing protein [Pseudomonadota bacterium]
MDGFRAILAVFGVAVIGLVYWLSRRESGRAEADENRIEPTLTDDALAVSEPAPDYEPAENDVVEAVGDGDEVAEAEAHARPPAPMPDAQKIVAILVVSREDQPFGGERLVLALRGLGLRHGQFGIFHHYDGDSDNPVFSVANLVEPGSFELTNIREQSFTGISLFMVLPGEVVGPEAFDMMINAARTLAKEFDGDLLDASGSTLSIQRERFMREEVIQFEHSLTLHQD